MVVMAAAAMVMTTGRAAAIPAYTGTIGIIGAIGLGITVMTARTTARTVLLHIRHEEILLSLEASASRDTLHPMFEV